MIDDIIYYMLTMNQFLQANYYFHFSNKKSRFYINRNN